ncbi:hypothetical protein PV10_04746 [Exophiala mesophila]|uniref:Major facilitator superfamily (MFS) profile domain-containing protein n=1 Tax=Exophiala mesophila TaxID=212818 RepID=A0A0D1XZ93_EXOME|nr:uncharacterized protein PV10_04746 [Exophiala mesophila]KIV93536.1 hypothetical protein PV10_04746 [Exophiala mesophila]
MNTATPCQQPELNYADEKDPTVTEMEAATMSPDEDRKLIRRLDLCLCPSMPPSMTLQHMDKKALPAASLLGIIQDLNMAGGQYSWTSSIFWFWCLCFTYFTPYLMVRWPIGKVLYFTFSIAAFSQIILVGLGFDVYQANLFLIAIGAIHGLFGIIATYICSRFRNIRCITSAILCSMSLISALLVQFSPNLRSFTKKSVATSMATVGYCAGNMIGPSLFFPRESPKYLSGFTATATCFGIGVVIMLTLLVILRHGNKRRDKSFGVVDQSTLARLEEDVIATNRADIEKKSFRYMI